MIRMLTLEFKFNWSEYVHRSNYSGVVIYVAYAVDLGYRYWLAYDAGEAYVDSYQSVINWIKIAFSCPVQRSITIVKRINIEKNQPISTDNGPADIIYYIIYLLRTFTSLTTLNAQPLMEYFPRFLSRARLCSISPLSQLQPRLAVGVQPSSRRTMSSSIEQKIKTLQDYSACDVSILYKFLSVHWPWTKNMYRYQMPCLNSRSSRREPPLEQVISLTLVSHLLFLSRETSNT